MQILLRLSLTDLTNVLLLKKPNSETKNGYLLTQSMVVTASKFCVQIIAQTNSRALRD